MIDPTSANLARIGPASGTGHAGGADGASSTGSSSFSDILKQSIDEVSKLQQDATKAVDNVATGQTDDITGVMTAVSKADLAFKTLLTIRSKLLDAYEEIKGISV
jgi:flagellar hook-basal body complex protein FliE